MHKNHFASWFKLFGSIRNLAERPETKSYRNGTNYQSERETGSNLPFELNCPNNLNQLEIWV